jgi:hypothetical protein
MAQGFSIPIRELTNGEESQIQIDLEDDQAIRARMFRASEGVRSDL